MMKKDICANWYQKCPILCSKILINVLHNLRVTVLLPWQHTRFWPPFLQVEKAPWDRGCICSSAYVRPVRARDHARENRAEEMRKFIQSIEARSRQLHHPL